MFPLFFLLGCPGPSPEPIKLPSADCVVEYTIQMLEHADDETLCELSYDALLDPDNEDWNDLHDQVWDAPSGELMLLCGNEYPDQQMLMHFEAIRAMRCVLVCDEPAESNSINCDYE